MMNELTKETLLEKLTVAMETKNFPEIINLCEKLIELDPTDLRYYWDASYAYRRLGNLEQANKIIDRAIEIFGLHSYSLIIKGDNYFDFGFYKEAEEIWESIYQFFPDYELLYNRWFTTLITLKEYDKAINVCKIFFQNQKVNTESKISFIRDKFINKMWFELSLIAKSIEEIDIFSLSNVFSTYSHSLCDDAKNFYIGLIKDFLLRNYNIEYEPKYFEYIKQEIINSIKYYRHHGYFNLLKNTLDLGFCNIALYESELKEQIAEIYALVLFFDLKFEEAMKFIDCFFRSNRERKLIKIIKFLYDNCSRCNLYELKNRYFKFSRLIDNNEQFISLLYLNEDGKIIGSKHPNETKWEQRDGVIIFRNDLDHPTSIFFQDKDKKVFLGLYFKADIIHKLEAISV